MLIFVIFIAIAIIMALMANNFEDINVDFGGWLLSFMTIAIGCAVSAVITTFIICSEYPKQEKVISSNTIYNLFDTTKTETNQFLFRTEIDDVECYKFYKNTSKGATLDIEPCNNIYIVESNKEIPRIDVINVTHKTNPLICFDFGTHSYYRIYVPKNTIVNDYNIDMK